MNHLIEPVLEDLSHGISKRPDAGKYHLIRLKNRLSLSRNRHILPQQQHSFLHTLYITGIIVKYRYHFCSPSSSPDTALHN